MIMMHYKNAHVFVHVLILICCQTSVTGQVMVRSTMIDLGSWFTRSVRLSNDSVYRSWNPPSFSHCVKECVLSTLCEAMTYDLVGGVCDLGGSWASYEPTTINVLISTPPSSLGIHGILPKYVTGLSGACMDNNCTKGTTCTPLSSGGIHCAITECSKPDPVPNAAMVSLKNRTVGGSISYTCNEGYVMSGVPVLTCRANGNWTDVQFSCQIPPPSILMDMCLYGNYTAAEQACLSASRLLPLLTPQLVDLFVAVASGSDGYCSDCPGVLTATATEAFLRSPNFPGPYTRYSSCSCQIDALKTSSKVQLTITAMDLESRYDALWVYDGENRTYPVLGQFTGNNRGEPMVSSGRSLYVQFVSDGSIEYSGFELQYLEMSGYTVSSVPDSSGQNLPPSSSPLYFWVLGELDTTSQTWVNPDGTQMLQQPGIYPSLSYILDYYADSGAYYGGIPFEQYRACFDAVNQVFIGSDQWDTFCHTLCIV